MYEVFESLLELKGVTVAEVSRATGISQSTLSNWKKRRNRISASNAEKLAEYFGVSVGYIFGVQEDEHQDTYYKDAMSAMVAQQMFEDKKMRSLFHIKRKIPADRFQAFYDMITAYYQREFPNDHFEYDQREFTDRLEDE